MATLTEQLDAMKGLGPNWDGYDADPPDHRLLDLAKDFVALVEAGERAAGVALDIRVYPTRIGGVQLEWRDARREYELELMPDGSVEMFYEDLATGRSESATFPPARSSAVAPGLLRRLAEASPVRAAA